MDSAVEPARDGSGTSSTVLEWDGQCRHGPTDTQGTDQSQPFYFPAAVARFEKGVAEWGYTKTATSFNQRNL